MALNSSIPPAYSISESEVGRGYYFTTEHGAKYWVYLSEADGFVPSASFADTFWSFGFARIERPKHKPQSDESGRIMATIFKVLSAFLIQYPELIIAYICSDDSTRHTTPEEKIKDFRLAKKRSEIFNMWYQEWQRTGTMPVQKIDCILYDQLYVSCLFRAENKHKAELEQIIQNTVLAKQ